MKIIHTADWHLGQTFYGYERAYEHRIFLSWLAKQISDREIDALLISGDVFDNPNPSAEAQSMFYDFIKRLTTENPQLRIVITAGNHDSAARLEAPAPILEGLNVTIRGIVPRTATRETDYKKLIVPLGENSCCLAVPYVRQGDYPTDKSYNDGVNDIYSALYEIARKQYDTIIAMGHMHATGSEISQGDRSERTIIGGLDCVDTSTFAKMFQYTALGHLHKAQKCAGSDNIRYSGAPLPMSFAERNNRQSVTLVTIQQGTTQIDEIAFDAPVKLMSIYPQAKPLNDILEKAATLPQGDIDEKSPFIEIRILIKEPEPTLRHQIEEAIKGRSVRLTRIEAVAEHGESTMNAPMTYEEFKEIDPLTLATDVFKRSYGQNDMPEKIKNMLVKVIDEAKNKI